MTWRDKFRPRIAEVLAECQGMPLKEIRRILRAAGPGKSHGSHLYKIWCDECRVQLGLKTFPKRRRLAKESGPGQRELFAP